MAGGGRLKGALVNLGVMAASVAVFLLLCEFVVFRFVLPASDVPRNAFVNEVVRYAPNQRGVWRVRDEIAAPFSINAQGWNSPLPDYPRERRPGAGRIAFIGDSFVEALQVPVARSFAEVATERLGEGGRAVEAYRYGVAGAPLSQYLQMLEREVLVTRPDRIVVLLIHNDFDESFVFKPGRYTSSFRKLRVENGSVLGEIAPEPWRAGALELVRRSATARYFLYRWQVRPQALIDAVLGPARVQAQTAAPPPSYFANIDVAAVLAREADVRAAADYVIGRMAARATEIGAKLHLVMDGDRAAIYAGTDSPALKLNAIAAEMAARHGVPFLDLHPVFAADWAAHRQRFEFAADAHWNERGHRIAGGAVAASLRAAD